MSAVRAVERPCQSSVEDGVETIEGYAFAGCASLTTVYFPGTLAAVTINYAFNECFAIKDVYYNGSEEDWKEKQLDKYIYGVWPTLHYDGWED